MERLANKDVRILNKLLLVAHTVGLEGVEVLAWLKQQGKGYQIRLNAILRQAMLEDMHKG